MKALRLKIHALIEIFEGKSLRERSMILAVIVVTLVAGFDTFGFSPLMARKAAVEEEILKASEATEQLRKSVVTLASGSAEDPDIENRRRMASLQEDLEELEQLFEEVMIGLVAPREMATMLEDFFALRKGLRLVSLENLGAEPWPPGPETEGAKKIFRHGVRLEFEGSYMDALEYFRALEALPRRLFWEDLELEVTEHPISRIRVRVSTLSTKEGWIGV